MNDRKRVVIVGGGPGGLCAAMLLARYGFDVTVFEKQPHVGGRSGPLHVGEYTFDAGSTMLMMRFVLEEMYELVGTRLADEVTLVPVEPMYRLDFGSRAIDMFADQRRMEEELRRFAPGSQAGLRRFLEREHKRLVHLYPVLQRSWPNLASLVSPSVAAALPHIGLGRSVHDTASDYFSDPALQLGFSFQAAYLGMSPWACPGGFAMVPYVEHAWGIDHVQGGIHQVAESMARIARSLGATVRTGTRVRRLLIDGDDCHGVELENGEEAEADDVVINADATAALLNLVDENISLRFNRHHLTHMRESCSTYMLYLGLDTKLPLAHHTFFFADDYQAEMKRVFETHSLGDDLSLYVCNPSHSDPTLAPPGHSSLYVLALVPNTGAPIDWRTASPRLRAHILERLARRTGHTIEPHVRASAVATPVDWAERYQISHGAVFGLSHSITQMLAFRLPNRLPSPHNVYLAGGSTNPGSGLPTILESGRIAARLVCERHDVVFPASRPLPEPSTWQLDNPPQG